MSKKISEEPVVAEKEFQRLLNMPVPRYVFWDIETGPISMQGLEFFKDERKIKYPPEPVAFDNTQINRSIKDQTKQSAWLSGKRADHNKEIANYPAKRQAAVNKYMKDLYDEAALKAHLNVVLAIGYGVLMSDGSIRVFTHTGTEKELTVMLWKVIERVTASDGCFFTFNGNSFDIPIMQQKAWKYNVRAPYLLTKYNKIDEVSVDAKAVFQMGNFQRSASLAHVAQFFGVTGKLKGVTGDMFHKMYNGGQRDYAMRYLWHDIDSLYRVCSKMRLLDGPLRILKSWDCNSITAERLAKKGRNKWWTE